MTKEELLAKIENLKSSVINHDVSGLISCIEDLHIDSRYNSPVIDYTHNLIVETIFDYVSEKGKLKVTRKGEYGSDTFDVYIIDGNILKRNGTDVRYSSLGKLYQAYKKISK